MTLPGERRRDIAGATHSWCEAGEGGVPLVLLHGIGSNAQSWAAQLADFGAARRVLAWNMPGYGGTSALAMPHPNPDDYAAALEAFLAAQGITLCDLVGHSLGGLLGGRLVVRVPSLVRRLVLSSPAGGYRVPAGASLPERLQARIDDLLALGPAGLAAKRAAGTVGPGADQAVLARVEQAMAAINPSGYTAAVWQLAQGDLAADAPCIACPTMVLVGSADRVTPPDSVLPLAALVPGAAAQVIPGAGHASYADHAIEYNAALQRFLGA
jgi:pimeloyl-ACP methyl ester carboxylesterase